MGTNAQDEKIKELNLKLQGEQLQNNLTY